MSDNESISNELSDLINALARRLDTESSVMLVALSVGIDEAVEIAGVVRVGR